MSLKRKPPPGNVRRTVSLGNNFRGVTTNKQGRVIQFESEQERKLVLLLERDPMVVDYISQPETLRFRDSRGRDRRYTPDFKVWYAGGQIELHEVTVETRRQNLDSLHEREAAAHKICQQRGWRYVVHTDQTLPSGYEYVNLDFLSAFRAQTHITAQTAAWWLDQLAGRACTHPRVILSPPDATPSAGVLLNGLYHLLWHSVVMTDLHRPLLWHGDFHPEARLWLPNTPITDSRPEVCMASPQQKRAVRL